MKRLDVPRVKYMMSHSIWRIIKRIFQPREKNPVKTLVNLGLILRFDVTLAINIRLISLFTGYLGLIGIIARRSDKNLKILVIV